MTDEARAKGSRSANRPRRGDELRLKIDRLAQGGRGVGRADGFVVFVPLTAPGDEVIARVKRSHRRFAEAEPLRVLEASGDRVQPPCPYFGECGGCAWQHLDYPAQLAGKEQVVRESLERHAGLESPPLRPIVGAEQPLGYRNKMEFSFDGEVLLGMHRRGFFDQVVGVEHCLLCSAAANRVLQEVRSFVADSGLSAWDPRTHGGLLRHLVLREGRGTGELLVGIVTSSDPFPSARTLASRLASLPGVSGVVRAITDSRSDAVRVDSLEVLHGRDHIFEVLGGRRFKVELETFFQTNTEQAEKMVSVVKEMAGLRGTEKVLDLFCGVGTFALLLAPLAKEVHGLEVVEASIESARETARREGVTNVRFTTGDARRGLPRVLEEMGSPPDLLLLDPPRSGAGGKVMRRIGRAAPRRVLYVSCNPATLASDLGWLLPFGYEVRAVRPLDLFPQTPHVETVVHLERSAQADHLPDPFKGEDKRKSPPGR
ncbi:MAG: 23S rRNA (uracil(1939)-C(5))-methyltransferase RlmD [Myxococcota bacterium]